MAVNTYGFAEGNDALYYSSSVSKTPLFSSSSGVGSSLTSSSVNSQKLLELDENKRVDYKHLEQRNIRGSNYRPVQSNVDFQSATTPASSLEEYSLPASVQSIVSSNSSEDMNMRFTDLTHMHLKRSIDQHHLQTDGSQRSYIAPHSTFVNSAYNYSSSSRNGSTSPRIDSSRSISTNGNKEYDTKDSCYKYQNIISAKNAILDEKEALIVKLRAQLGEQSQLNSGNSSARSQYDAVPGLNALTISNSSTNNYINSDYQAASMRVKVAETFAQQERNVNDLHNLLGKTELQLAETKTVHEQEKKKYEEKIKELEFCLRAKQKSMDKLTTKHKDLIEKNIKYKKRVESLERYLSDLPTVEETANVKRDLDNLNTEKRNLITENETYKDKYNILKQEIQAKEEQLHNEAMANIELENKIKDLILEINSFKDAEKSLGISERKHYQNALLETDVLRKEREDAARLLSAADTKIKDLNSQYSREINLLNEKLIEEETAVNAVKMELASAQQNNSKIQITMAQFSSQNQQLVEEKLNLIDQLRQREGDRSITRHASRMNARLHREIQTAVQDLQSVTNVLIQSANGDDPNLSALLGVYPTSVGFPEDELEGGSKTTTGTSDSSDADGELSIDSIKQKLSQVRRLRKDIDDLRANLSNKYAENIGQNCATQ